MTKIWYDKAWDDYMYWLTQNKKTLKRINMLIKSIESGESGRIGKAELLKHDLQGWYSIRIDEKNRLVYRVKDGKLEIAQCKGHYDD